MNDIILRALQRELLVADGDCRAALAKVGHMNHLASGGRVHMDAAIATLQKAAGDYDAVANQLEEAERARIASFNAANNAPPSNPQP